MKKVKKVLSIEDRKLIHELYLKVYYLIFPLKKIKRLAEEDIKRRKWYDKP